MWFGLFWLFEWWKLLRCDELKLGQFWLGFSKDALSTTVYKHVWGRRIWLVQPWMLKHRPPVKVEFSCFVYASCVLSNFFGSRILENRNHMAAERLAWHPIWSFYHQNFGYWWHDNPVTATISHLQWQEAPTQGDRFIRKMAWSLAWRHTRAYTHTHCEFARCMVPCSHRCCGNRAILQYLGTKPAGTSSDSVSEVFGMLIPSD